MLESPWLDRTAIALSLVSVAVVAAAGLVALPLSVDGGWYSYPSFAWSLGRDPFSSQVSLELARQLDGLAAVFAFETTSSVRLFYTTAWFEVFGTSFWSLRAVSMVELAAGASCAYLLFRSVFRDRSLALLTTALLLTDKTLVLGATTDYRPDVALLAGSCALFALLHQSDGEHWRTVVGSLVAVWVAGTALSAPIPLAAVFVAQGTRALRDPEHRSARLVQVTVVGAAAVLAFVARQPLFYWLLDPAAPIADPVDADGRIFALFEAGPAAILAKEAFRFRDYFWVSNLPLLLTLGFLFLLLAKTDVVGQRLPRFLIGPLTGLAAGLLVMALLDPHRASQHMMPLIPFALLAAGKIDRFRTRLPRAVFAGLIALSALASMAVGARQIANVAQNGGGNEWRQDALAELFTRPKEHLVLGPVELWPLLPTDREIVLADFSRNPDRVDELDVQWSEVDYVLLNQDYDVRAWVHALEQHLGHRPCPIIDRPPRLVVVTPTACPENPSADVQTAPTGN